LTNPAKEHSRNAGLTATRAATGVADELAGRSPKHIGKGQAVNADYGLWPLVIINSVVLILFAASFFHPRSGRDWRAMGAYSAFIVALFTEMYGVPLTIYLLSGWLGSRFPALQATHSGGHPWNDLMGWKGDPHVSPFHMASYVVLLGGFWLISAAWNELHKAARQDELATAGPYAWVRHPQYVGFLLQWPTIPTLVMFPVLVVVYARLAKAEEREVATHFPETWPTYADRVHRLRPHRPHQSRPPSLGGWSARSTGPDLELRDGETASRHP
jgi:protein-S-isoprenylcysteine O-methyltransferase Ste14